MPASHPALRAREPQNRLMRGALVAVRWKKGNPHRDAGAIRVAQRLALGMAKPEIARAERQDEAALDALLARDGFAEVIEAWRTILDEDSPAFLARLEKLCRIALHNALMGWDVGAALFAMREMNQGRDPARTLAQRVRTQAGRLPAPMPPVRTLQPPGPPPLPDPDYDPLDALVQRSAAKLRRAVLVEQAQQIAAGGSRTTAEAMRAALAARRAKPPRPVPPRRGRCVAAATGEPAQPTSAPDADAQPRRTRAP